MPCRDKEKYFTAYLSVNWLNLLECSQNKHSGFSHTRLGLAQNVHSQDGLENENRIEFASEERNQYNYLGDTLVLDLARMLKSTVYYGSQDLRLEQEVPEAAAVDGDVVSLDGSLLLGLHSVLAGIGLHFTINTRVSVGKHEPARYFPPLRSPKDHH